VIITLTALIIPYPWNAYGSLGQYFAHNRFCYLYLPGVAGLLYGTVILLAVVLKIFFFGSAGLYRQDNDVILLYPWLFRVNVGEIASVGIAHGVFGIKQIVIRCRNGRESVMRIGFLRDPPERLVELIKTQLPGGIG
jgi:hypothetical protein